MLGIFGFFTIILPLIRSKNLCFLGSLCNFSPLFRSICISCDDCESYDKCSEYTPYTPIENNNSDVCGYCCDKCCHYTATYGCMFMCFFIDIFKCPYSESYLIEKNGDEYVYSVKNDPKYDKIANMLTKHDRKNNIFKPPPMQNPIYVQPSRIEIND
jgi:hypothetical protein